METMLHGSQFYMLFKEAFHIYSSFFETNKDEEAFRAILLHPETELNVVIVTHPVYTRAVCCSKQPFMWCFNVPESLYARMFIWWWVSKSLPPSLFCILKKHPPPLFPWFWKFYPPPTLNTGPPLSINNEQSLKGHHHDVANLCCLFSSENNRTVT